MQNAKSIVVSVLFLAILFISFQVIAPYLGVALIAVITAALWQPVTNKTREFLPESTIGITNTLIFCLVVIIPISLLIAVAGSELYKIIDTLNLSFEATSLNTLIEEGNNLIAQLPFAIEPINADQVKSRLVEFLKNLPEILLPASNYLIGLVTNFILFLIIFSGINVKYQTLINYLRSISPIPNEHTDKFIQGVKNTSKQVIVSTLVIGFIQAAITLIVLLLMQIDYAILWSIVTLVAAILPVGAGLVLFPLGLVLLVAGESAKGLILLLVGFLLVNVVDNLLRPKLAANEDSLPESVLLLGILGGIGLFGITGLLIGPVILTLGKQSLDLVKNKHLEE